MASIASLLNPEPEQCPRSQQLPTPCSSRSRDFDTPPQRQKKQKISKDAAIFTRGKIKGELRYPPCEYQDRELNEAHQEFEIHPMGHITEFPRHIPYNSEKKSFLEKTGRESFEVFQYTFKMPGEDKRYTVMWDYNIGLVRTTSLFKCNNYSKTAPGKMLDSNPGLRDICHSITGGALAAQGYWMPFEAAKAVAATFCWKIRYALTPLFGVEFISICIPPHDPKFGRMIIDPEIVKAATATANKFRDLEIGRNPRGKTSGAIPYGANATNVVRTAVKNLRPKIPSKPESEYANSQQKTKAGYESLPSTNPWDPADNSNTDALKPCDIPSPRTILASLAGFPDTSRQREQTPYETSSDIDGAGSTSRFSSLSDGDDDSFTDHGSLTDSSESRSDISTSGRDSPLPLTNDARAAYMLMRLHMQEAVGPEGGPQRKKRRAST